MTTGKTTRKPQKRITRESLRREDVCQLIDPVLYPTPAGIMHYLYSRSAAVTVTMTRQVTPNMTVMRSP